jgi:two-component system, sensor histidine kinase
VKPLMSDLNEPCRIAALESYGVLDTPPETAFDDLTALASLVSGQPVALVSLVDEHRQWFKSRHGFSAVETPRDVAFCSAAIRGREPLIVSDARIDARFASNPLVTGPPHIRSYCGVPLVTPQGQALGTLCVIGYQPAMLTRTQVSALEQLARQVMTQLELRRTSAELLAARDSAERARAESRRLSMAKSNFLAMASHEMLTPLNAVVGLSDLLRHRVADPEERAMCAEIHASGRHLETLLTGMIDLSILEAGKVSLAATELVIAAEVDSVFEALEPLARRKGLPLIGQRAPGAPSVLVGDSIRLRQVLSHLVDNAIKFTTTGSVQVHWRDDTLADGAPAVRFDVIDTGSGMGAAEAARLFERFASRELPATAVEPGLGLGLAITRLLVSAMGGTLGLDSQPGRGTTFTVILPQGRRHAARPAATHGTDSLPLAGWRVLVVDDNDVNRMLAARLLGKLGCEAIVADHGEAALAIDPTRYDCVLMDCQMPVMDGLSATREMRRRERESGAASKPIIAVTASVLATERGHCREAGMDDCVSKPLNLELLQRVLARQLL